MITVGVYSNVKHKMDRVDIDNSLTECCRGWDDPSPIHYMSYGTQQFTESVNSWFTSSSFMSVFLETKRGSLRSNSPRRLSPRIWNLIDNCTHIIIFMHEGSDECFRMLRAALSAKNVRRIFAIKI